MSTYALIVSTPPTDNKTRSAFELANALVSLGHQLNGIFFYQDGVLNANCLVQTPSDEVNLTRLWQDFQQQHNTPLYLCISAAERRGLSDTTNTDVVSNIAPQFTVSGLGELAVLTSQADKVIQL